MKKINFRTFSELLKCEGDYGNMAVLALGHRNNLRIEIASIRMQAITDSTNKQVELLSDFFTKTDPNRSIYK